MDYNFELAGVEAIRNESLDQVSDALKDGHIDTYKYRKRMYEITLIEANTIKYIDRKPQYALLHSFMWDEGEVPSLAWSISEAERDSEKLNLNSTFRVMKLSENFKNGTFSKLTNFPPKARVLSFWTASYIDYHYLVVEEISQILIQKACELGIELTYTPKI